MHERALGRSEREVDTLPSIARQPDFNLLIANRTPDEIDRLAAHRRASVLRAGLYLRVKNSRIRARYSSGGRYASYPKLRGHLQRSGSGTRIVAAVGNGAANPAFIVCAPAALLLGSITVMNQAMRRTTRKREIHQLTGDLRRTLQDGDA